jgi:23S rRNA pseudouridine1911/1915/1917 synthase
MFNLARILYEDNHLIAVNKLPGELVQPDTTGDPALEDTVKEFIRRRDNKPGNVFLGVVHRIDRPVSGVVIFAKTGKALARLNAMLKNGEIKKTYWAITENRPEPEAGPLVHHLIRDAKTNKSKVYAKPVAGSKEARLNYNLLAGSDNYYLVEVELLTGRHHQIRAQFAKIGANIKGDLKYGAARSNRDGSISLHSRSLEFPHPVGENDNGQSSGGMQKKDEKRSDEVLKRDVKKEDVTRKIVRITAPVPETDNLWQYFSRRGGAEPHWQPS